MGVLSPVKAALSLAAACIHLLCCVKKEEIELLMSNRSNNNNNNNNTNSNNPTPTLPPLPPLFSLIPSFPPQPLFYFNKVLSLFRSLIFDSTAQLDYLIAVILPLLTLLLPFSRLFRPLVPLLRNICHRFWSRLMRIILTRTRIPLIPPILSLTFPILSFLFSSTRSIILFLILFLSLPF